jgi:hypothetical protein
VSKKAGKKMLRKCSVLLKKGRKENANKMFSA